MPRSTGSSITANVTGCGADGSTSVFAEMVPGLPIGRALDLGCGEGADAVWLAERGWHVVAVDISDTALQRARSAPRRAGWLDRIDFQQHDLSETFPGRRIRLVSAHFLHSTCPAGPHPRIPQRAAEAIRNPAARC